MEQTPTTAAAAPAISASDPLAPAPYKTSDTPSQQANIMMDPVGPIISPETAKKILKMQILNWVCSILQLGCALAIIFIVRYNLALWYYVGATITRGDFTYYAGWSYVCLAATPYYSGTCEFAYALASLGIFFALVISLLVCLTMGCAGMARVVEAVCHTLGLCWWTAGTVVLGLRANEANNYPWLGGTSTMPQYNARNAVVAMAAVSAFLYLVLLVTNLVLIKTEGKAYKHAAEQAQLQQFITRRPIAPPVGGATPVAGQADAKLATAV